MQVFQVFLNPLHIIFVLTLGRVIGPQRIVVTLLLSRRQKSYTDLEKPPQAMVQLVCPKHAKMPPRLS